MTVKRIRLLQRTAVCALLGIVIAMAFAPVLRQRYTMSFSPLSTRTSRGSDRATMLPVRDPAAGSLQDEPWLYAVGEAWGRGEIPLVNLDNGLGTPLLADLQAGALYPLNVLLPLLGTTAMQRFDWFQVLHVLIFALGCYRLFRWYARNEIAALLAATTTLSPLVFLIVNMVHFRVFAWTPWLCAFAVALARRHQVRWTLAGWAAVAICSFTAGNPQESLFALYAAGLLGLAEVASSARARGPALLAAGAIAPATACLALPVVLPYFAGVSGGDLWSAAHSNRGRLGVPGGGMADWVFPRLNGALPFRFRAGPLWTWQPAIAPVVWIGVGLAAVAWWRRRDTGLSARRRVIIALTIGAILLGLLKVWHPWWLDFVAHLPFFNSIRYEKYASYIGLLAGVAAAVGLRAALRDRAAARTVPVVAAVYLAAVGLLLAGLALFDPEWRIPENAPRSAIVPVVRIWIASGASAVVVAAAGPWWHRRWVRWTAICLAALACVVARPGGFKRAAEHMPSLPAQTDTVTALPLTDTNWVNGINRHRAGFTVAEIVDLAGIQPGEELQFAHSGRRRVERVTGPQVWVSGSRLDPEGDGAPLPVRLVSDAGLKRRRRFGGAMRTQRVLTARTPNTNLLSGINTISVFDPVHNRRLKEFLRRHFDLEHAGFCLHPKRARPLDRSALAALRLLGVHAVEGYRCRPDAGFVSTAAQAHLVPDPLPAAFLVRAEALPAVRAAQAAGDTAGLLRALLQTPGAIHPLSMRRRGANRVAVARPDQVPPGALLVVSLAYSRSWTLQGRVGEPFAGVLTAWPNPPAGRWRVRYWPPGLTAALWLALAGLVVLAVVGWIAGRTATPCSPVGSPGRPMKLSLCLLTWNELAGCKQDLPRLPLDAFEQVFAVDGGSDDGTVQFLEGAGVPVHRQDAPGYNAAYHSAFRHCTGEALIVYHPKGTIDPACVLQFRPLLEAGNALVIASRLAPGAVNEEDSRWFRPRKWFVRALALTCSILWRREGHAVQDILHGVRAMRADAFQTIEPQPAGVAMDVEMVVRCYRHRLPRAEFPVAEAPRPVGRTHFPAFRTGRKLLAFVARELFRRV